MKTLLLHNCCGPCGFSTTKFLNDGFNIKYYWYNPNIQPLSEYEKRLNVAKKLFSLVVDEYNSEQWLSGISVRGGSADLCGGKDFAEKNYKRCAECYRLRLTKTAQKSKELKTDFFSTTLLISPYQYHEILKKTGEEVAKEVGANFYYYDGRRDFYKNLNEFKKLGLYTQKYCGCLFSKK
ncbi:MAG: epoxyqueuosine reductase QueH [Elusimicrobiota bacterium]